MKGTKVKVFVVVRADTGALCKVGPDPKKWRHADPEAWTIDIREAALFGAEMRAYSCRDRCIEAGIDARVMVLTPQPW
jgi:hypothetical protein